MKKWFALLSLVMIFIVSVVSAHALVPVRAKVAGAGKVTFGLGFGVSLQPDGSVVSWKTSAQTLMDVPVGLSGVADISAGDDFIVALKSDGTVAAWGDNTVNQCDVPAGLSQVIQVAAGENFAAALKSDGSVVMWGDNTLGQCNVPAGLTGVVEITTCGNDTVALKSDGSLVSWGEGDIASYLPSGPTGAVAISGGMDVVMALKADGTVAVWGLGIFGETSIPSGLSGVVAIAAGGSHCLALKSNGSVVAWGKGDDGQADIPAGLTGTAIGAGGRSLDLTAVIDTNGVLHVLGANLPPGIECDVPDSLEHRPPVGGVIFPPLSLIASGATTSITTYPFGGYSASVNSGCGGSLAGNTFTTAAVTGPCDVTVTFSDGLLPTTTTLTLLNNPSVSFSVAQVKVDVSPPAATGTVTVKVGSTTLGTGTLANGHATIDLVDSLKSDTYIITAEYGGDTTYRNSTSNAVTQTVNKNSNLVVTMSSTPNPSYYGQPVKINLGTPYAHTVDVTLKDGDATLASIFVTFNGSKVTKALTQGTHTITAVFTGDEYFKPSVSVPLTQTVDPAPIIVRAKATGGGMVAAGAKHVITLKPDGTVTAWGDNSLGQCNVPAGLSGVAAVSAGANHNLALKSDGTVVAWGQNVNGSTVVPAGLSGVTAVAAGESHSVALKSDGTVVMWGDTTHDQGSVPAGLTGVVAVSAGAHHTIALQSDGNVVGWGNDLFWQATVPSTLSGVVAISAGFTHNLALLNDGTVTSWGHFKNGLAFIPYGLSGVIAVSAGHGHSMALKSDGTVVGWGDNSLGQTNVPTGLSGAVLLGSGYTSSSPGAVDSTGKVHIWGANDSGQYNIPDSANHPPPVGLMYPEMQLVSPGSPAAVTVKTFAGYTPSITSDCGGSLVDETFTTGAINAPCEISVGFTDAKPASSVSLSVSNGWSLLSSTISFEVATVFGDSSKFTSIWKWASGSQGPKTWAVYLPGEQPKAGAYAESKGFVLLSKLEAGEGFWVNAKVPNSVEIKGTPTLNSALTFTSGWNLVGLHSDQASGPADLVAAEPAIVSIWKWDTSAGQGQWAVYLTSEGQTPGSYAASKGFMKLETIKPGEGFWVNKL